MNDERVEEPEREGKPASQEPREESVAPRSRLRQALVCPYCKDDVRRRGAVVCGRRRCGAFYHRECWDECSTHYGGCAVYGCESKKSREVSVAGYLLRLLRLFLAALLFPPRLARAIKEREDAGFREIYRRALADMREVLPTLGRPFSREYFTMIAVVSAAIVVLGGGFFFILSLATGELPREAIPIIAVMLAIVFAAAMFLTIPLAVVPTFAFYMAKFVASIFAARSPLSSAPTRAEAPSSVASGSGTGRRRAEPSLAGAPPRRWPPDRGGLHGRSEPRGVGARGRA